MGGFLIGEAIEPLGGGFPGAYVGGVGGKALGDFVGEKIGEWLGDALYNFWHSSHQPTVPAKNSNTVSIVGITSQDPNAIDGPAGYGSASFVAGSDTTFPYQIDFENSPTAGAGPGSDDRRQLDPNLNRSTFQLNGVGFGETTS